MDWLNVLIAAFAALATFFAACIAWLQYQLGQRQFQHDLYDRRLKVFQAARSFLSDVGRDGGVRFRRCIQFYGETSEAEFLFGADIVALLNELYLRGVDLALLHEQLYPEFGGSGLPVGPDRSRVAQEQSQVLKAMMDSLGKLKDAFKPYMLVHQDAQRGVSSSIRAAFRWTANAAAVLLGRIKGKSWFKSAKT